ncbi:MAG: nucleotide sugar dehydrogenase [Thermodesulfobacteriota bacterium]|nr:nucleotide sugar dehydrogenase [Thermodesulfobacteriota bacterium]
MGSKVSVVGLGKLGMCLAACLASKGYSVIGVDIDKQIINAFNEGKTFLAEPSLGSLLESGAGNFRVTILHEEAISQSDLTFIIVPTPSRPGGSFSDIYLQEAIKPLAEALGKNRKPYHLFVITSTVSPGTIENNIIPWIEKYSGRVLKEGFGVCYSPSFIALGSVVKNLLSPDVLLIGENSEHAGNILQEVYEKLVDNKPYLARMSIISAEITKIALNAYVTMKISFANSLANICEKIPGSDIDQITSALGGDRRIGKYYLKGGPAFGGPCFPRDNRAFAAFAEGFGGKAILAKASDQVNHYLSDHLSSLAINCLKSSANKRVSIIGLSYKPGTPVIEESPSLKLIDTLLKENISIIVYDPLAIENVRKIYGNRIEYARSLEECLDGSSLWIVAVDFPELRKLDQRVKNENRSVIIIDCWRVLDGNKFGANVQYIALGRYQGSM